MPDFGIFRGFGSKLFSDKLYAGQLPTQLGLIGSESFGVDTDAQAFFDRVTAAGGTLSATEKTAIDTLVRQMKTDGIWAKMKAIYPMVGASSAACSQNLKSSSFTGTFTSGWTFASTGVKPTNGYMNTNLSVSSNLLLNSSHLSYYSRTNSNATEVEIGSVAGSNGSLVEIRTSGTTYYRINSGGTYISHSDANSQGFYIGNRTASNVINGWKNGIKLGTGTTISTSLISQNIWIGALNENNLANYYTTKECSFSSIGDGLTDTEASNFYTAVQAFQTTLSRNV